MRHQGKITTWNDRKGYGLVTQNGAHDPVFLHVSDFLTATRRPAIGDLVTYEMAVGERGKGKAIAARFVSLHPAATPVARNSNPFLMPFVLVAICASGYLGYTRWSEQRSDASSHNVAGATETSQAAGPVVTFRCEGKQHCSQMTSCEEATFYLQHCAGTAMDGDGDGIPCERQWCGD